MARVCGDGAGGIGGLVELIRQHGGAIDADFQRFYGMTVADVICGRVTLRRFRDLFNGLPAEGTAQWRHARRNPAPDRQPQSPPDDWWTGERDLLAGVIDSVNVLVWLHTKDAQDGKNRPKPIPRPGVTAEVKPVARLSPGEAAARLAAIGPSGGRPGLDAGADEHDQPDDAEGTDHGAGYGEPEPALAGPLSLADPRDGQGKADQGQDPETPQQ